MGTDAPLEGNRGRDFTVLDGYFWCVSVLAGYEMDEQWDNDPDDEYPRVYFGLAAWDDYNDNGGCDAGEQYIRAIVFIETIRDGAVLSDVNREDQERRILAHEIGHWFGLDHVNGTIMQGFPIPDSAACFSDNQIAQIRNVEVPGLP